MVKICIESVEVTMSGDIGITAKYRIITKAKLDSIRKYSYSERPQVVRVAESESTGQGLVRTRLSPKIQHRKSVYRWVNINKVSPEIVNAMDQKKKMKFMILFLLLMAQDWFFFGFTEVLYDLESPNHRIEPVFLSVQVRKPGICISYPKTATCM